MTGTHLGEWHGIAPTSKAVRGWVLILFPWNRTVGKFAGEKIFVDPASFVR
jgi:hypothetical protein